MSKYLFKRNDLLAYDKKKYNVFRSFNHVTRIVLLRGYQINALTKHYLNFKVQMYPYLIAIGISKIINDKKFLRQILQLFGTTYIPTVFVMALSS